MQQHIKENTGLMQRQSELEMLKGSYLSAKITTSGTG